MATFLPSPAYEQAGDCESLRDSLAPVMGACWSNCNRNLMRKTRAIAGYTTYSRMIQRSNWQCVNFRDPRSCWRLF